MTHEQIQNTKAELEMAKFINSICEIHDSCFECGIEKCTRVFREKIPEGLETQEIIDVFRLS